MVHDKMSALVLAMLLAPSFWEKMFGLEPKHLSRIFLYINLLT